jgi:hypothetical protein
MEKIFELARERGWSLPSLRNHLSQNGLDIPLPTLRSWAYGKRQPSFETITKLEQMVSVLGKPSFRDSRKMIRFRVTHKQIQQAKTDSSMAGIAVSGVRGSKKSPMRLDFFEGEGGIWLPLADVVLWRSHVEQFNPSALCFFQSFFDLLTQSPNSWLPTMLGLQPFANGKHE